jgi:HrpA-like RNA helicase
METSPIQVVQIEREPTPRVEMPAVQARILLADQSFLNPNSTEAPELKEDTVAKLAERSYGLFEAASLTERKATQNNNLASFDEKYTEWSDSVVKCFNADSNKQKVEALRPLLKITNTTVNDVDIKQLYDRYLDSGTDFSGVKAFVKDVIVHYEIDGKYDVVALEKDRDSIKWAANLFGSTSSEMIDQLITAEMKLLADPEACYVELNKERNNVTVPQKKMMAFIYNKTVLNNLVDETKKPPQSEKGSPPIEKYKKIIQETLLDPDVDNIIVSAETGAGKSTKLPQYVKELFEKDKDKVVMTQPRRLPTEALAERIADEIGVELGEEVGFKHGMGSNRSEKTDLETRTEGSLRAEVAHDQLLQKYDKVIVDEWHERHEDMDILVGLLLRAQKMRKDQHLPPLKLIFSSATINGQKLMKELGNRTRLIEVEGRSKPIEDRFIQDLDPAIKGSPTMDERVGLAAKAAARMVAERNRHIVIFMPGDRRIRDTQKALEALHLPQNVVIDTLSGSMTQEEQQERIKPSDGKVHIIIATNVAETSLTIPGVDVISSGYANVLWTDSKTGLTYLTEKLLPNKNIKQQRGRTGRESDGMFWYLGTREEYEGKTREDNNPPEITRNDLSRGLLFLKSLKLDFDSIQIIDRENIPQQNISRAERRLKDLGALDQHGDITEIGKEMTHIKLDIHLARTMVEARKRGCVKKAAAVAVMVNEYGSLFIRSSDAERARFALKRREDFPESRSDFIALSRYLDAFREVGLHIPTETEKENAQRAWANTYGFQYDTLIKACDEQDELLRNERNISTTGENTELEKSIVVGYRDNLLERQGRTRSKKDNKTNIVSHIPLFTMRAEAGTVQNAQLDRNTHIDPKIHPLVVTAGNYRRQKETDSFQYMQINQVVDPSWLPLAA